MSADYEQDDGYGCDYGYELDYDDDPTEGREPSEPDFEAISYWEHEERMASLSAPGRAMARFRDFAWRRTWHWRMKMSGRWLLLTGRATTDADGPPF